MSGHHTTTSYFSSDKSGDESAIDSGPSFNESLQRFRSASSASPQHHLHQSSSSSQQQQQQVMTSSSKGHQQRTTTTTTAVTKSVEEQRTMITRNSQKSYHIE